jgi:hypothetical protein
MVGSIYSTLGIGMLLSSLNTLGRTHQAKSLQTYSHHFWCVRTEVASASCRRFLRCAESESRAFVNRINVRSCERVVRNESVRDDRVGRSRDQRAVESVKRV